MPPIPFIPGAATYSPMLMRAAVSAAVRPESFVGQLIMPDTETPSFNAMAPVYGNEDLEAYDDDTIGRGTTMLETMIKQGYYEFSIGSHGRMAVITQTDLARAMEAGIIAAAMGGGGDPSFDLERRLATLMLQQNGRHNEVLILAMAVTEANYSVSHVFPTLNVRTSALVRETIMNASNLIEADTGWPANTVIFGTGARTGAEQNANWLALLPENAPKVLTKELLATLVSLPDGTRAAFATAKAKRGPTATPEPIMNNHIWVGRVVEAQDDVNATFGRNYWKKDHRNKQRVYTNRLQVGVQEDIHISLTTHYRPSIQGKDYGVLIPTTSA